MRKLTRWTKQMEQDLIRLAEQYHLPTNGRDGMKALFLDRTTEMGLNLLCKRMNAVHGTELTPSAVCAKYKRAKYPDWWETEKKRQWQKTKANRLAKEKAKNNPSIDFDKGMDDFHRRLGRLPGEQTKLNLTDAKQTGISSGFVDVTVKLRVPLSEILNNKNIIQYIVE